MVDRTLARRSGRAAGLGVAALMALLLTPPAPAWSWQEPVALETLEVTATLQKDAAQQRVQQAQRNLAQDMADVLRDEPAIQIGGGSRNAQRFYLRGIEASNLNIRIDGASQGRNLFQHRGATGGLDADLLKSVSVATLPASDQGGGALGGSILFETVDAQDLLSAGRPAGVRLKGSHSSADDAIGGAASAYGRYGDAGLLVHVSGVNAEDYRSGAGNEVQGSAGRDRDYFAKFSLLDRAGHSLRLSAEKNENSGLYRWGAGDGAYDDTATLQYQISERQTQVLDYRFRRPADERVDLRLSLFHNEQSLDNTDANSLTETEGYGGDLRNTARFHLGATGHELTLGVDLYQEEGRYRTAGSRRGGDNQAEVVGLYVQERMKLGPLQLAAGLRYDDYSTDFGAVTVDGDEFSPSAGAELALGLGVTLFAGYGEAVRSSGIIPVQWLASATDTPTFNQRAGKDSFGKGFKAETSQRYEGGLRFEHGGLLRPDDGFEASLTLFETEIEDLIVQIGGSRGAPVTGFYNDDAIEVRGWELRLAWQLRDFRTSLAYSRARAEDAEGQLIGASVGNRRAATTGDRLLWDSFWQVRPAFAVGYTLDALGGLDKDAIDRSGYVLHHLQADWQTALDGLSVQLAVRNLLDRRYSEQTSVGSDSTAVYEPGRDVRLALIYRY
ncbi:TonB-dependent receptor domain-containing protein [Desulfuromonas thiophila]|uniref:Hemoglobin/transferrin/lactoferrin receptor protein n=1 Tax=Desulfuromonas thiophila TaxID=57664 RepID=A0A1G6X3E2_9BACT|nr:TonB-dependent receptor [Desulfuromonas thiophila]SDD72641.1 hemoglobin/transferrin/lactoferrin receptor protein [Desulfuromonas thiophila]